MVDFAAIRAAAPLSSVASLATELRQSGSGYSGRCPFHDDRHPSFSVYADDTRFRCHGCGASGDILDFVQLWYGIGLIEAAEMLGDQIFPSVATAQFAVSDQTDRIRKAEAMWEGAAPAPGTIAEAYLRARGISCPIPPGIRFANVPYGNSMLLPCLIAALQNPAGNLTGVQRTYLRYDGLGKADVPKPKLALGVIGGSAIRLGEPDETGTIAICEGLEDGLSLVELLGLTVWVSAGASNMPAMQFPSAVHSIIIGIDNDHAGEEAARLAGRAYIRRGLNVRLLRPDEGFKDFNDELQGGKK